MSIFRSNTKIGDIFSVNLENGYKKYFQLIAYDLTQLNSDVIRSFKDEYKIGDAPSLQRIIDGEIEFYAHCVTKSGLKLNLWIKEGNITEVGNLNDIIFRDTNDYSNPNVEISNNWYIWRINDKDFTRVGKLIGENRKAEIGIVINPFDIVNRIKTGKYQFQYPNFE